MSRFHSKYHRHNHHTTSLGDVRYPDAAYDPIASPDFPFQGDMVLADSLSVGASADVGGSLVVDEFATVVGNLEVGGNTTVVGSVSSGGSLTVASDATIGGNLVSQSLRSSTSTITQSVSAQTLTVDAVTNLGGALTVSGTHNLIAGLNVPLSAGSVGTTELSSILDLSTKTISYPVSSVGSTTLSGSLNLSDKTLIMPANHWTNIAPLSGTVVQTKRSSTKTEFSLGNVIPLDNTTPLLSEGHNIFNLTITPLFSSSWIKIDLFLCAAASASLGLTTAIFRDSSPTSFFANYNQITGTFGQAVSISVYHQPLTTNTVGYSLNVGVSTGIGYINRIHTGSIYGGLCESYFALQELKI